MDWVSQITLGILTSIAASYLYDLLKKQDSQSPPIIIVQQTDTSSPRYQRQNRQASVQPLDHRAVNRGKATAIFIRLFFFVGTWLILYSLIFIAFSLNGGFFSETFDFGKTKLISLLYQEKVPANISLVSTIISIVLYLPVILIGDKLLIQLQKWYDHFWPVTIDAWLKLRFFSFIALSILFTGLLTFIITDLSFWSSLITPPLVALMILAFALGDESKRR